MQRIGFLGTGSMGRPMIAKLLAAGYPVEVNDIKKSTATTVVNAGARWHDTPRETARDCDIVITCLPLPEDVFDNMTGDDGGLAGMKPGSVWIDTSTTDYHNTLDIARRAEDIGVASLEAPVSNLSHMGVDFANASFFIGGDAKAYAYCKDALDTMGVVSFHVGRIGQGQSVKLLTNLLFYTAAVNAGDAFCKVVTAGIPAQQAWRYFALSEANSVAIEQFMPFVLDGSFDSSCTLEIAVKDMGLTVALADELGVALPVGRGVEKRYSAAGGEFDRYDGHLRVIEPAQRAANVRLEVPGYTAPSKYGANPSVPPDMTFIQDAVGRTKPRREHYFPVPDLTLDGDQVQLLERLAGELADVNRAILEEGFELGRGMGMTNDLIGDVITWSVGASSWSDDWIPRQNATVRRDDSSDSIVTVGTS